MPARPDLPRFAAFCRAVVSPCRLSCNANSRLRPAHDRAVGVCTLRVIEPARVILRASNQETVQPGEILIAPFTDPGWTPYFVPAAAIVMDQGGLLSHGSIVAREYGIPAVVNVGPATKLIRTGQIIQVDGDRGEVRVLDES